MPSKKKTSSYHNKITSEQFKYLLDNEIKVYAVSIKYSNKWRIQVSIYGKLKTFDKEIAHDDIQESIDKTMLFYHNKLKEGKI